MKRLIITLLTAVCALCAFAQDEAAPSFNPVAARMNKVRHPVTKKWGYAFKEQNINSPLHGAIGASVNLLGGVGSQLISKKESELIDWVIPPQYDEVDDKFREGLAMVRVDGKVGFINVYNCFVIPPVFDGSTKIDGFRDGLAAVCLDGRWGFINHAGVFMIAPDYEEVSSFNSHHVATVKKNGLWGAIDLNGAIVVPIENKNEATMTTVPISNKPYLDASKNVREAYNTGYYAKRIADIQNSTKQSGKPIKVLALDATEQSLTYTTVGPADSLGVKDQFGRWIVPPLFSSIEEDRDDHAFIVCRDNLYGCYLWNGARLIGTYFDSMTQFRHGASTVTSNGIQGWIDLDGIMDNAFVSSLCDYGYTVAAYDDQKARAIYERCTDICPDYASAYNNMALLDFKAHDYNKGMRKLKLAAELEPDNETVANNLRMAKEQRKERRAQRWETGLQIALTVIAVSATAYATYSAVSGSGGGDLSGASGGGAGVASGKSYDYYLTQYRQWESKAKNAYGNRVHKKVNASTSGDHRVANGEAKLLRQYQQNMRSVRETARRAGHNIPMSEYENCSF